MITGSKELIRDINSHLILEMILQEGLISRADLAKKSGLTKATVSAIVQRLLEEHLVIETGNANTSLGRKPILLTFHASCGYALSVDVNANVISAMVCNLRGENCRLKLYPNHAGREEILPFLITIIRDMTSSLEDTPYGVVGIGLGIHGTVYQNQVTFTPYSPYENLPFQEILKQEFKIPIYLENEANLSVIGEHTFYYHTPNLIGISIHTGIGVGIIINGQLYTGSNGNAGEFGHSIIEPEGRPCPCGNSGCLEQYASERSILRRYADCKGRKDTDINDFVASCSNQDKDALLLLQEFIRYISYGMNNLLNTFNPDMIVINSSFTTYFPEVLQQIEERLNNRMKAHCVLAPSKLQDTSILLGAACVCIRNFLGVSHLTLCKGTSLSEVTI